MNRLATSALLLLFAVVWHASAAIAQVGSAFSYQGYLEQQGQPADGAFDFRFLLFDAETEGQRFGDIVIARTLNVENGVFSTELDFTANAFDGSNRWLEVRVRQAGGSTFTTLRPRQRITASPYALHAQSVAPGSITQDAVDATGVQLRVKGVCAAGSAIRAIASNGAVTCEVDDALDSATVQRRVVGQCAAGSSIRQILADGAVVCEPDNSGSDDWFIAGDGSTTSDNVITVSDDSHPGSPTLSLVETADDFTRLRFRNTVNTARHWTLAVATRADQTDDRFNFFNPGAGDVLSLTGQGWVGAGTAAPVAPLAVQGDDLWRPEAGNGFGDFHVGNGIVGLSLGVALGGGGAGTTRVWTHNSQPLFFGNDSNGMLLGVGTGGGGNISLLPLAHAGPDNQQLEVRPNGDVVATEKRSPTSLFREFGGRGEDGNLTVAANATVNLGTPNGVLRREFQNLVLGSNSTLNLNARYNYIAVSGVCQLDPTSTIDASGSGMWGGAGGSGIADAGSDGQSGRVYTSECVSGAGGNGRSSAAASGGRGGSAEGTDGAGDTAKRLVLAGTSLTWTSGSRISAMLPNLLKCPGGGGGGGATGGSNSSSQGGHGGPGGGVIYLECKNWAGGAASINASGLPQISGPVGTGVDGGSGGGGVVIVRVGDPGQFSGPQINVESEGATANRGARGLGGFEVVGR